MNLLVKCKADAASKNKSGKLAADLARDPAVKEVLNKAMADVSKPQEHPVSSETGNAEPSGEQSTASLAELNDISAQNAGEIGPQERPTAALQDSSNAVAPLDNSKQSASELLSAPKRTRSDRHQSQPDDPEPQRPSKVQKIALSFAEDDDDS